jgi:uncharacterized protein
MLNPKEFLGQLLSFAAKATYVFLIVIVIMLIGMNIYTSNIRNADTKTLAVDGKAKQLVQPDTIIVNVGTILEGSSVVDLQKKATDNINKATDNITKLGIPGNKIQTANYDVSPKYDNNGKINGYSINISLKITIENVTTKDNKAGSVISAATDAGLNEMRGLSYEIKDEDKILDNLKLLAIDDAKSKKDSLAKESGIRLGEIKDISFGGIYPLSERSTMYAADVAKPNTTSQAAGATSVTVQPGETELTMTVTIFYNIL